MYRVPYLRFAARFPICSFSGVKCWYGNRLDVTVVTSHVTTAYNFAEKTFTNWLQTAKFAKVFSLESFPLYSTFCFFNLFAVVGKGLTHLDCLSSSTHLKD